MSATGKTYKFSSFQELIDTVPGDRILDCMKEIGVLFSTAKLSTELVSAVARNIAKQDGVELPADPIRKIVIPVELEWMDDGKGDVQANLVDHEGKKMFSVNSKVKA